MSQKKPNERILFGWKVKQLRQERGLSFAELAALTGISVSYLNEIEKGKKYPRAEKMQVLVQALGRSEADMLAETDRTITPVQALLRSNFLQELPLELFGVEMHKVVEVLANAPIRVSAFISTLLELSRNYSLTEENFYFGALRAYLELQDNYFPALEQAASAFSRSAGLSNKLPVPAARLGGLLQERYGYRIVEDGLAAYPVLAGIRSVYLQASRKLLLNSRLSTEQLAFQFAKELGFNYLNLNERANTAKLLRVHSFEEALSHFQAGYFAAALLVPKAAFVSDLRQLFRLPRWDEGVLLRHLLEKYRATPEMLLQRMSNLLPESFGLGSVFVWRMVRESDTGRLRIDRELRLDRQGEPSLHLLQEHYCRRWMSVRQLQGLSAAAGLTVGVQRSVFAGTGQSYLCISIVRPGTVSDERDVSLTIGLREDEDLRSQVRWLDDPRIPVTVVGTTCERCAVADCRERSVPPSVVIAREHRRNVKSALDSLEAEG
ncbi:MAG: hypothetical protein RLY31_2305 [Bacteroidota bacterium]|jgi:transcriptional regulator with XRE-family HTH domain